MVAEIWRDRGRDLASASIAPELGPYRARFRPSRQTAPHHIVALITPNLGPHRARFRPTVAQNCGPYRARSRPLSCQISTRTVPDFGPYRTRQVSAPIASEFGPSRARSQPVSRQISAPIVPDRFGSLWK
jgi:hypothetical protein